MLSYGGAGGQQFAVETLSATFGKAHRQNANAHNARKNGHGAIPNAQRSGASLIACELLDL